MPKQQKLKKILPKLTESNYYSNDADLHYMSVSQFKSFMRCEAETMAKLKGEYEPQGNNTALLVGSYVDSAIEGTLEQFKVNNPEIFTKTSRKKFPDNPEKWELLSDFTKAEEIVRLINKNELFMQFLSGEKQVILTFNLFDVDWKIKMDSFVRDICITDLKTARNTEGIPKWRYDLQGAIYQKGVELNSEEEYKVSRKELEQIKRKSGVKKAEYLTEADYEKWFLRKSGIRKDTICDFLVDLKTKVITYKKRLPFYLAVATKEDIPELNIFQIPQSTLDLALMEVEENLPHIMEVKTGKIVPTRCECCDYCRKTRQVKIRNYNELLE